MALSSSPGNYPIQKRSNAFIGLFLLQCFVALALLIGSIGNVELLRGQESASDPVLPGISGESDLAQADDPPGKAAASEKGARTKKGAAAKTGESNESAEQEKDPSETENERRERINSIQKANDQSVPWLFSLFVWIGLIFTSGLIAKGFIAFTDPQVGLWTVMFAGTMGAIANIAIQIYLFPEKNLKPISLAGFFITFFVAFLFILVYTSFFRRTKNR